MANEAADVWPPRSQVKAGRHQLEGESVMPVDATSRRRGRLSQHEGIIGKRKGSLYKAGRTDDWLKIKTPHGIEVERKRFDRG